MQALDPLDFFATLAATPGVSLVVFVKPGCGACKLMQAALARLCAEGFDGRVWVVDAEAGPGLVADYEVFHFPALFLWRDGEYHAAVASPPTTTALRRSMAEALARPAEPEP